MSTRSRIAYQETENGPITSVYCHNDGYPAYNGQMLLDYYNTLEKVKELVSGGDMSSLDERCDTPGPQHHFDHRVDGYTVYYGRDRGETNVDPDTHESRDKFEAWADGCDYAYLFAGGKWFYKYLFGGDSAWEPLTQEVCDGD